ncbi:DUF968 domain-containing protein [Brenneria populi subsp. brevivirga]|uniref:DUF968 domain-containing protein n=1 Tax=Brenneria populi TaxID=1505588 RepID=UPI002E18A092|nr:DUF968 domain-containing protein [Brenneria populi subsp. brevivirga]
MRALLSPVIVPELGQVILRPGKNLLSLFRGRVLIVNEPEELRSVPSGPLPNQSQQLANDQRWRPFFTNERVITAADGVDALVNWLKSMNCQWQSEYHSPQSTVLKYGNSAIRLCWHCDNQLRGQEIPALDELADRNAAEWVIEQARIWLALPEGHQVTAHELSWWAVVKQVSDLLPEHAIRISLRMPAREEDLGPKRECDIVWTTPIQEIIEERIEQVKPVISLVEDEEPPAGYMLRPKLKRLECEKYTRWVKSQPCACCGAPADDPHHVIGYGLGGMGTKAHDLFVIPLCRSHHDELHRDVAAWETQYGSQLLLLVQTLNRALGIGAISIGKLKGVENA